MGPFLLEYGHKDEVEFVEKCSLTLEGLFGAGTLDDEIDDKVANPCMYDQLRSRAKDFLLTLALLSWQDFPSCHYNIIEDL